MFTSSYAQMWKFLLQAIFHPLLRKEKEWGRAKDIKNALQSQGWKLDDESYECIPFQKCAYPPSFLLCLGANWFLEDQSAQECRKCTGIASFWAKIGQRLSFKSLTQRLFKCLTVMDHKKDVSEESRHDYAIVRHSPQANFRECAPSCT